MTYFAAGVADKMPGMDANTRANLNARQQMHHTTDRGHNSEPPEDWLGFPESFNEPSPDVTPVRLGNGSIYYFDTVALNAAVRNGVSPEELILARN